MEMVSRHVGCEDEYLTQRSQRAGAKIGFNDTMLSRRTKGRDFMISENSSNPEQVKAIADSNNPGKIMLFEEFNGLFNTLTGCQTAGLSVDAILRDALLHQIQLAHPRLRVPRVKTISSRSHDLTGKFFFKESCCMI